MEKTATKKTDAVADAMNAVLENMRIKEQSGTTDNWTPDYTLNRNASLEKIGKLVNSAFDYFHDEDDEYKDGTRDCLFSLLEELFPGAVRTIDHPESNDKGGNSEEITSPKIKPLITGGISRIKTGPGEDDVESVEGMLMKLATVHLTLSALCNYSEAIAANDGMEGEYTVPVDRWAVQATFEYLNDIKHTLKCARFGHQLGPMC